MHFHIQLIDGPDGAEKRKAHVAAHWDYFDANVDHFFARGATTTDDQSRVLSSVLFVDFESWDAVRTFVDEEPLNSNGTYSEVHIRRWSSTLGTRQRDYPRREGDVYWYVRGYGIPDAHARRQEVAEAQNAYLAPYDRTTIISRGPILDDDGVEWQGSANLIAMPSRAELEAFMAEWPYCKAGLYERVLIERYRFGGRPGQVV